VILGLEDTISARDNVRIMERSKSPAVMTYYDVGNSTNNGFEVVPEIRWLGKQRICEVHLKDNPNFLGKGKIDFPRSSPRCPTSASPNGRSSRRRAPPIGRGGHGREPEVRPRPDGCARDRQRLAGGERQKSSSAFQSV
jgi:hypothetical protein